MSEPEFFFDQIFFHKNFFFHQKFFFTRKNFHQKKISPEKICHQTKISPEKNVAPEFCLEQLDTFDNGCNVLWAAFCDSHDVFTMAFCLKGKAMVMGPPVSLGEI